MMMILWVLAYCLSLVAVASGTKSYSPAVEEIIARARIDGIDLPGLPFASAAFASIEAITIPVTQSNISTGNRVDTHVHVIPDWYRALVPLSGGFPTPPWTLASHLQFMATNDIGHDIISISTPGSGVYPGNEAFSAGLARLLNEWVAALVRTYPSLFSFYATAPLPYVEAAISEIAYARAHLGAIGTVLLTNHEGKYLGNPAFTPFFSYLNSRNTPSEVVFIHPNSPVLNLNGTFISADPSESAIFAFIISLFFIRDHH